jgi:hypothetical protein
LFFADAKWFSLASLTWLTMLLQFVHIALLAALAWLLLWRKSLLLFLSAITVILNLMLSPFQMQNFVWGMQIMFPLVFVAATGAFLCLPLSDRGPFLALSVVLGLVSSYTMPNGILIWPVLALQSIYLKQNRRVTLALAGIGAAVIATYLWHYSRSPEIGMGVTGMLRHPVDASLLVGIIVGSPFRLTLQADAAVGLAVIVATGYIFVRALLSRVQERKWFSALSAIILFLFLSSLSIVAGRLTLENSRFVGKDYVQGRYFTMICLIWVSIALLLLSAEQQRTLRTVSLCAGGVVLACLMFTSLNRQGAEAADWAAFFKGVDAVGSAFLLDAPDEQLLSVLWPSNQGRDERVLFLRQQHLAMFHETRAQWPGQRISELFPASTHNCAGAIEKMADLGGASWRIEGWAWDAGAARAPADILLTDTTGRIIGLARGGLRHGYFPGFFVDAEPALAPHAQARDSEWLGYVRKGDMPWTQVSLYGLFRNDEICAIR